MILKTILFFFTVVSAELDFGNISPADILPASTSRHLHDRRQPPDFGGKQGIANGSDLSKHKNKIKSIGVKFFKEDPLAVFKQDTSWNETYEYDASVGYYWFGRRSDGLGTMNILVKDYDENNQPTSIIGSVSSDTYVYNFQSIENGLLEVTAVNGGDFPKEADPEEDRSHRSLLKHVIHGDGVHSSRSLPENGSRIDVICFYTRKALCAEAGQSSTCNLAQYKYLLDNKCALAISETNVAYQNSGVVTRLRLVYSGYLDVSQASSFCSNLDLMRTGTASAWVNARNLRASYKADLMHMIIDDTNYCGCAYMNSWVSVSHRTCTTGYYSFGHEIGHNLGCRHDPTTEANMACSQLSGSNFGYQDPSYRFRSIMAYNCQQYCPRIQYFSTPNVKLSDYQNASIGSYCENNVAKINSGSITAANYMDSTIPSRKPSRRPTRKPSPRKPTRKPSLRKPTRKPSVRKPTRRPSRRPTFRPTFPRPSGKPTREPTLKPTILPSISPTSKPSISPTVAPTIIPSIAPTSKPSFSSTVAPTIIPSIVPTSKPSFSPTVTPTTIPSIAPTSKPSFSSTVAPTIIPSNAPTSKPSLSPTLKPTHEASTSPSTSSPI